MKISENKFFSIESSGGLVQALLALNDDLLMIVDVKQDIIHNISDSFAEWTKMERKEFVNKPLEVIKGFFSEASYDRFSKLVKSGVKITDEHLVLKRYNSDKSVFLMKISYAGDKSNSMAVVALKEVSENRHAESKRKEQHFNFDHLAANFPCSVEIYKPNGLLIYGNEERNKIWHLKTEKNGVNAFNILEDRQAQDIGITEKFKRALKGKVVNVPLIEFDPVLSNLPGRKRWVAGRLIPNIHDNGEVIAVVGCFIDLTSQQETELKLKENQIEFEFKQDKLRIQNEELKSINEQLGQQSRFFEENSKSIFNFNKRLMEQEDRMKSAMDMVSIAYWEWNREIEKSVFSSNMASFFALKKEYLQEYFTNLYDYIYESHKDLVEKSLKKLFAGSIMNTRLEFKMQKFNKATLWVKCYAKVTERDSNFKPSKAFFVFLDVTKTKELDLLLKESEAKAQIQNEEILTQNEELRVANEELRRQEFILKNSEKELKKINKNLIESEKKFKMIAEQSFIGLAIFRKGKLLYANDAFFRIVLLSKNLKPEQVISSFFNQIDISDYDYYMNNMNKWFYKPDSTNERIAFRYKTNNNEIKWVEQHNKRIIYNHQNAVLCIFSDITDRIKADKLKRTAEIAENAAKIKQEFLANMSHEIRTPLTGIIGMIDLLKTTKMNKAQVDYLETMQESTSSLLNLINDILEISRIEAGKLRINPISFNILQLTENIKNLFASKAKQKNITFSIKQHPSLPVFIKADAHRLTQVISNLVSNAVKFTESGNIELFIEVRNGNKHHDLYFSVTDSGIGIKDEDKTKVFGVFDQLDMTNAKQHEGSGLGLAISKKIIGLMHGEIGVESQYGKGSMFWFSVPVEINRNEQESKNETFIEIKEMESLNLRILLVEDKQVNQKVLSLLLKNIGCEVEIVGKGDDAVKEYNPAKYDIVLMDIQMPVMDGFEATRIIKSKYKEAVIIGLSANAFAKETKSYKSVGMDDYLTKPVKINDLYQKLDTWKKSRHL